MNLTYDVWFEAAMLPILFILSVFLSVRFRTSTEVNKRFRILAWSTFACTFLAVVSTLMLGTALPRGVILLVRTLYYAAVYTNTYHLLRYVIAYVDRYNARAVMIHRAVLCAGYLSLLLNLRLGFFFSISADAALVRGPYHLFFRAAFVFYFLAGTCILEWSSIHKTERGQFLAINLVTLILIATFAVQYFVFRDMLLVYTVATVLLFVIFFYLEAPVYRQMRTMQTELEEAKSKYEESSARYDAASRAKSDFLANTSHEIRTPMNAILGMNDMIARESHAPEVLSASHDIRRAGENLLTIINNILDISKAASGKMELYPDAFFLSEVIGDMDAVFRERIEEKGVQFVTEVNKALPEHLYGDEDALRRVIGNLLDNAIKYTDQGAITMHVLGGEPLKEEALAYYSQKGRPQNDTGMEMIHLQIMVEDTGIGMRKEEMDKLFEAFERVNLKETQSIQGAGLGLPLAQHLVHMMGGQIRVDSVYGEGSAFTVDLPLGIAKDGFKGTIGEYETLHANEASAFSGMDNPHCLVVDDTEVNLTVAKNMLEELGATVVTASSGEEALKRIKETAFDIVFLDHRMPGMDGEETLFAAKKLLREARPEASSDTTDADSATPVFIALTASSGSGQRAAYRRMGFDDFVSKPMEKEALRRVLEGSAATPD